MQTVVSSDHDPNTSEASKELVENCRRNCSHKESPSIHFIIDNAGKVQLAKKVGKNLPTACISSAHDQSTSDVLKESV